jgi:hypothetical protein
MFKTLVMVCFLNAPPAAACVQFEDTTGLKEIEEQCYIRALEMIEDLKGLPHIIRPPYTISYKCELTESVDEKSI